MSFCTNTGVRNGTIVGWDPPRIQECEKATCTFGGEDLIQTKDCETYTFGGRGFFKRKAVENATF